MMADSAWMLMYLCCHSACSSRDCLTPTCTRQVAVRKAGQLQNRMLTTPRISHLHFRTSRLHSINEDLHLRSYERQAAVGLETPQRRDIDPHLQPGDCGMQGTIRLAVLVYLIQHAPAAAVLSLGLKLFHLTLKALHVLRKPYIGVRIQHGPEPLSHYGIDRLQGRLKKAAS